MRIIALDVHRDFCEVAIAEGGQVRRGGRLETTPATLELFARSLAVDDQVVLEATGNALAIARILEPVGCVNTASLQTGQIRTVDEFTHPTSFRSSRSRGRGCAKSTEPATGAEYCVCARPYGTHRERRQRCPMGFCS